MHIAKDRKALKARVKRLAGQVRAIEEKIDDGQDADCYAVLHLLASARGALDGLTCLFLEGHIRQHVVAAADEAQRERAGDELAAALKSFLK